MQQSVQENYSRTAKRQCYKSVFYISFVILFFQAISNTQLGIVSQFTHQNGQGWVGPLSTSLLFFGSGIASVYNNYISKMHYRYIFLIGSLGYTLFIGLAVVFLQIGFTTSVKVLILIGSFVSGCTVSVFYNGQFNYVNTCSQIDNEKTKYFGINMCIVQSANIVGNVISAVLIEPVGQINYAIIMNVSIFVISLFFLGVKDYKYSMHSSNHLQRNMSVQQENLQNMNKDSQSPDSELLLLKKNENIPLQILFVFCFSGIMISFIFCQLSVVFYETFNETYKKQELNRITFVAFIIQGVGQFMGGLSVVFGQEIITKRIGISFTFIFITFLFLLSLIMFYYGSIWKDLILLQIGSFIAGYCDCMGFALALSIAGKWQEKGITFFNIGQSSAVAVTSIMIAFIKFDYIIIWCIVIYIISTISVLSQRKNIDHTEEAQFDAKT